MEQHNKNTKLSKLSNQLLKPAFAFAAVGSVVAFSFNNAQSENLQTKACVCDSGTTYNTSLPSSHPNNRCASEVTDLSWGSWLTGNSRSTQFHFIDLIELLHGHEDKPLSDLPSNTNHAE
ncbi:MULTISPECIES: hypothetical protein [Shewanella]|uniref:hypothetical protein n=1 Tax=Shewanella TaxID=22 RepID=UPI001A9374E6|nr:MULTISPECIES: hypothetical protein [Shewanella]